jgi:DNA-binding CsgD family transcriptional regulator
MRLSAKDFDAVQRTALELHACRDLEVFARVLAGTLADLIPSDSFILQEFEFSPSLDRPRLVGMIDPERHFTPELAEFSERELLQHPFPRHFVNTGDWGALLMSDFVTVREFQRTEAYDRVYRRIGVNHVIGVPARFGARSIGGLTLGRHRKDFNERDRRVLDLLRPHIEMAHDNALRWTRRQAADARTASHAPLTARELEVGRWLAEGKTNREIAVILQSNVRTIEKHVENMLRKLGVENRTAAAVTLSHMDGAPR